jgi:hypothetical protein
VLTPLNPVRGRGAQTNFTAAAQQSRLNRRLAGEMRPRQGISAALSVLTRRFVRSRSRSRSRHPPATDRVRGGSGSRRRRTAAWAAPTGVWCPASGSALAPIPSAPNWRRRWRRRARAFPGSDVRAPGQRVKRHRPCDRALVQRTSRPPGRGNPARGGSPLRHLCASHESGARRWRRGDGESLPKESHD